MIINFSTKFPKDKGRLSNKPTFFCEKIWSGLLRFFKLKQYEEFAKMHEEKYGNTNGFGYEEIHIYEKIHTIREDKTNRWKKGNTINFYIGARTVDMFNFAPDVECKSTQKIRIKVIENPIVDIVSYTLEHKLNGETYKKAFSVYVDDYFLDTETLKDLAHNDGFESLEDFFEWFNEDFTGKIIHWTDLKY